MNFYEDCLGNLYVTSLDLDYEDLYCEMCGDCDIWIGFAETKKEMTDILNKAGYEQEYIKEFIKNMKSEGGEL